MLSVPKLTEWATKQGLEVDTQPPIEGFQFVQVEAFLCAIERKAMERTPHTMAAAIVQTTPHLAGDPAAEVSPRWLVGADAHQQWRRLMEKAIQAGELVLLHFGSKLPIQASTEPEAAPAVNRGTPKALTDAQEAEVVRLYDRSRGVSVNKLARRFGVSNPTIDKTLRKAGVKS